MALSEYYHIESDIIIIIESEYYHNYRGRAIWSHQSMLWYHPTKLRGGLPNPPFALLCVNAYNSFIPQCTTTSNHIYGETPYTCVGIWTGGSVYNITTVRS